MDPLRPITAVRDQIARFFGFLGEWGYLLRDTAAESRRALLAAKGRRLGWANVWAQMVRVGVRSIPIVSLVLICIGAIISLQTAPVLARVGMTDWVANLTAVAIFRELGPLMAAIVLTGFAGASIAAELGSMVVSEEIDALEAHAISPVRFLVVPRVLATTVMMVCLAVVANLMGLLGGLLVSHFVLDINYAKFIDRAFDAITLRDFLTGLTKAAVFGMIISSMACYLGLRVTGGAEGVGRATTRTVVLTIVGLIVVDLMFTAFFYFLDL